jgi:23S rRNA (uracil1939-C5)-methyltransferase
VQAMIGGAALRSHVLSFFQGNRHLVAELVDEVSRHVPGGEALIDLYGGVGLFALPLAGRFAEVVCVEGDPVAVTDARANARAVAADNVRVLAGDVVRVLGSLPQRAGERVIIDPPRAGAGPAVVDALTARRPLGVTYVSCDPPTLARDLARFVRQGYALQSVAALDLFPGTYHIETVAHLARVE